MFESLRRQLLRKYIVIQGSVLILAFLLLYTVYIWSAYRYQEEQVEIFAFEEAEEYWYIFRGDVYSVQQAMRPPVSIGDYFYYAYDRQGTLVGSQVSRFKVADDLATEAAVHELENNTAKIYFYFPKADADWQIRAYLLIKRQLYDDTVLLGTLYAGKDITGNLYQIFHVGLFMLLLTAVIMMVIYRNSLVMVEQAMLPIMQALALQKRFTADASHELRTPLSVLLVSLECIRRDKASLFSDFAREVLADIDAEIGRMRLLIENLLLLARSDNHVSTAEPEVLAAADIIREKCRNFSRLAAEKQLKFVLHGLDKTAVIMADARQFDELLGILLDNAIKYTPAGGIITVSLIHCHGSLSLSIADTGCGIEPEELDKIFERFYRSDKARSSNGGVGLGLSIAKHLAAANDMKISVTSQPGQGSTFTLFMYEYDVFAEAEK